MTGFVRVGGMVGLLLVVGSGVLHTMNSKESRPKELALTQEERKRQQQRLEIEAAMRVRREAHEKRLKDLEASQSSSSEESKEAKSAAQSAKEKAAAAEQAAVREAMDAMHKIKEEAQEFGVNPEGPSAASQSSSSGASSGVQAIASKTVLPMPFAGSIRGLDDEGDTLEVVVAEKNAKEAHSTEIPKQATIEETPMVTIGAADRSKAEIALPWVLQLPPVQRTFDGMHEAEASGFFDELHKELAQAYKEDEKSCVYGEDNKVERVEQCPICKQVRKQLAQQCCSRVGDKIERIAGCPLCKIVVQSWFVDKTTKKGLFANKKLLDMMVNALRMVYEKQQSLTPRDMADFLALQLNTKSIPFTELDLMTLWRAAWRLELTPLAAAAAMRLLDVLSLMEKVVKESVQVAVDQKRMERKHVKRRERELWEQQAREAFASQHALVQPLIDQMAFEQGYAQDKASALSISMLRAYSFLPMNAGNSVDEALAVIQQNPQQIVPILQQLPDGGATRALWKKAAPMLAVRYACASDFIKHYQDLPIGRNDNDPRSLMLASMKKLAVRQVGENDFDRVMFDRIPEVYFKYLLRIASFAKNRKSIDDLPIDLIIERLRSWPRVDLSGLQLRDVTWLSDVVFLTNEVVPLEGLVLDNNDIVGFPEDFLESCAGLLTFSSENNHIVNLPFGFLHAASRLQVLNLSKNRISLLPPRFLEKNPALRKVDISGNELVAVPRTCLQNSLNMFLLALQENKIVSFPDGFLRGCYALQYLYLAKNRIARVPDDFLQDCTDIRVIFLEENEITAFPKTFLQNHTMLRKIYLEHNKLGELPDGFLQNCPHLDAVSLYDNPWTVKRPNAQMKALKKKIGENKVGYDFPWWYI